MDHRRAAIDLGRAAPTLGGSLRRSRSDTRVRFFFDAPVASKARRVERRPRQVAGSTAPPAGAPPSFGEAESWNTVSLERPSRGRRSGRAGLSGSLRRGLPLWSDEGQGERRDHGPFAILRARPGLHVRHPGSALETNDHGNPLRGRGRPEPNEPIEEVRHHGDVAGDAKSPFGTPRDAFRRIRVRLRQIERGELAGPGGGLHGGAEEPPDVVGGATRPRGRRRLRRSAGLGLLHEPVDHGRELLHALFERRERSRRVGVAGPQKTSPQKHRSEGRSDLMRKAPRKR